MSIEVQTRRTFSTYGRAIDQSEIIIRRSDGSVVRLDIIEGQARLTLRSANGDAMLACQVHPDWIADAIWNNVRPVDRTPGEPRSTANLPNRSVTV